jgi:hypothetical protein
VLDLLFKLSTWHGLAKLRLHTDSTLDGQDTSTTRLGHGLRHFKSTTCCTYDTRELPSEEAVRGRRTAAVAAKKKASDPDSNKISKVAKPRTARTFSLMTYKLHALSDYVHAIRMFGTSDGFTTQTVCVVWLLHATGCLLASTRASWNIAD